MSEKNVYEIKTHNFRYLSLKLFEPRLPPVPQCKPPPPTKSTREIKKSEGS